MSWDRTIDDALEEGELILDAINQVRDPELEASEYGFWDEIQKVHPAPSHKGNDGLANWIANLAVIRSDEGKIVVDEGLIEEADNRLTEEHDSRYFRKRFNNIIRDSENRPREKDSLAKNADEGLKDEVLDGHHRLIKQVDALYSELGEEERSEKLYKDKGLLPLRDYMVEVNNVGKEDSIEPTDIEGYDDSEEMPGTTVWEPKENDTISSKPENNQHNKGGDNDMTDYDKSRNKLAGTVAKHTDSTTEIVHGIARLERNLGKAAALETVAEELEEEAIDDHRSVQSYLDNQMSTDYKEIDRVVTQAVSELDNVDVPDTPSDASANALDSATGYTKR